jgi:pentapeptide MXKDX repeat protein
VREVTTAAPLAKKGMEAPVSIPFLQESAMKTTLFTALIVTASSLAFTPAFAQDAMARSSSTAMTHGDAMHTDAMKGTMSHDSMKKDGMMGAKHPGTMKHDAMKKGAMKKDGMQKPEGMTGG